MDEVLFRRGLYAISAVEGGPLFDPNAHGLHPGRWGTACYRGFVCQYEITQGGFVLTACPSLCRNRLHPWSRAGARSRGGNRTPSAGFGSTSSSASPLNDALRHYATTKLRAVPTRLSAVSSDIATIANAPVPVAPTCDAAEPSPTQRAEARRAAGGRSAVGGASVGHDAPREYGSRTEVVRKSFWRGRF